MDAQCGGFDLLSEEEEASKPTQTSQKQDWGVWRLDEGVMDHGGRV